MTAIPLKLAAALPLVALACAWVWLICLGRGLEWLAARPAAVFAVVLFVLAAMVTGVALAHGDAAWIMVNMISAVMRLGDRPARAIMTPRHELDIVDLSLEPQVLVQSSVHSRPLAWDPAANHAVGVVR